MTDSFSWRENIIERLESRMFPFSLRATLVVALSLLFQGVNLIEAQRPETSAVQASLEYNAMVFEKGQKVPFIGVFTHTEPGFTMEDQIASSRQVLEDNPHLAGITIKVQWNRFHPEKDVVNWALLEELIQTISSKNKIVNFGLIPGLSTPEWVYAEGAAKVDAAGFDKDRRFMPVLWDKVYVKCLAEDLKAIAERYADDPRISGIIVLGHNYKEEMHAPDPKLLEANGYSHEVVMASWKYWIDLYGELFPEKKLNLVVSQMYKGTNTLPMEVATYFVQKHAGRAVLQTDQLNGREESRQLSDEICRKFHDVAPHAHEMVGSFKEQAVRQGSAEMTVYNFIKNGNPLYLQLWRRDCNDPQYAESLLNAMDRFGDMQPDEIKAVLVKENLYIEKSDWDPSKFKPSKAPTSPVDYKR